MSFLTLLSFLLLIILTSQEVCNFSLHCESRFSQTNSDYCAVKKRTDSPNIFDITVKKCESSICNIHDILLGDNTANISCQSSKNKNPSYPGGKCDSDLDCLSGVCQNNICKDSEIGDECTNHENCPLNSACINNKCSNLLNDNEACTESYQCNFNSFCNQKNKKCEKLFSYSDDYEITDLITDEEKKENLCISGGYISEKDENTDKIKYICKTLYNKDYNCNDVCKYYSKNPSDIEKLYISEEKCMCGYNKYRSKHCVLGNGENLYKEYLEKKKEFLNNELYIKQCHTLERDSDEICNELINNNKTFFFRKFIQDYNNKKINALQFHRLQESEPCIKEVVFNYDSNPIFALNQQCPIFSCSYNDTEKNCLYGNNPLQEDGKNISIILNPLICSEKEYCITENNIMNTNSIMNNKNIEGQCEIFQGPNNGKRYPGEDCILNTDCILQNSTCKNGKCTGFSKGENCNNTSECTVGNYCNKDSNTCQEQKDEGGKCVEGWDCKNFLGCFKGRCIKFGILKNSVKIEDESFKDKKSYLCATGELEGEDGIVGKYCAQNDYDKEWIEKANKKIDKNNFIECEYDEYCYYTNAKQKNIKKCGCGYNNKGKGYCPLPSGRNLEEWKNRVNFFGESATNNCHSLSRFNCYLQNDYDFNVKKRIIEQKTTNAHLFYCAVDCAFKIFIGGSYLKVGVLWLGLFLFYLFN